MKIVNVFLYCYHGKFVCWVFFLVCAEGVYGHLQLRCVPLLTTWFLMQEHLEKLDGSRDLHVSAPDDNISKNELKNVP